MSESGREALPGGREAVLDVREWLGVPQVCMRVVGSPTQKSGSGRESLLGGREAILDVRM